jgi:tRNA (guanine10-N2)-dimethyltransferase
LLLARDEVLSQAATKECRLQDNFLFLDDSHEFASKLGQCKGGYEVIFHCSPLDLLSKIAETKWQDYYKGSFKVNIHGTTVIQPQDVAHQIWPTLKNPIADMNTPRSTFEFLFTPMMVVCATNPVKSTEKYEDRRAHLRPEHHPSSLHPRLARTLINLTGAKKGDVIVDPMCGAGGFLLEAAMVGAKIKGYDIDPAMIERARLNLAFYQLHADLKVLDINEWNEQVPYFVTDVPYGRSTKTVDRDKLYAAVMRAIKRNVTKRAVIIFPHYSKYKDAIHAAGLHIAREYDEVVHATLTRKIVVIDLE